MKIGNYENPHSSFLSVEKDLELITNKILKNERLKRLLYYTTRDALDKPNIGDEATYNLFGKNIKIIPKLYVDDEVLNYLIISIDDFNPNETNPEFRNNVICFDILCHYDQWHLSGFQLRPFKIAAELDSMFNNKHLTGIGTLQFKNCKQLITSSNEFEGIQIVYSAIHGGEDEKNLPNPIENDQFIEEFNQIWNDK